MSYGWKSLAGSIALGLALQGGVQAAVWVDNGHEYQVFAGEGISWTSARTAAQALGAGWDLATITSAQEDAFVASLLPVAPASRSHYWIGATDGALEGSFAWVTGEPFIYANWHGGEPNNLGNEDFLAYDFRSAWAWNDAPDALGSLVRGYVAERSIVASVPAPGSLALLAAGLGLVLTARRRGER